MTDRYGCTCATRDPFTSEHRDLCPMRKSGVPREPSFEASAIALLKYALGCERNALLLGPLRAVDIAAIAASVVTCCPSCGAEPWVNIDCDLCLVMSSLDAKETT